MKTAVVNWKSDQIRGLLLTAILSISLLIKGQDYKIMKIITSQYPVVKATFLATGNTGEKITNALPEDFKITENNRKCDIIEVTNPREIAIPASIVLMFDVSLSMTGERLELAKKAAKGFIEQMPLETSEVAIASFSDEVYVNCDFTQNQERLFHAIDNLRSVGGTNYSKAFLDKGSGAISIAANGRHKKNIIFLTDGLSNTDVNEVVSQARQSNTTIYCITLELPIPDILRDISQQTGGTYFEAVANINQLDGIYSTIFQMLEVTKYGTVTWKANQDCRKEKNVHFVFRNKPVTFTYDIPKNKTGSLDIDPSVVAFGSALPGASKNVSIDLIARNIPLNITHIAIAGKGPFSLTDSIDMPYLLKPDHVKNITLNYKPKDTKIITDKLIISTRECPDKSVVLHGGSDEQLRLICPKGGEQLVVGTDTSIQWEGVKKEKTISIFYRTHPDKDWKQIGEGQNLILPWITPNDTSHQVQVMLKPKGNGNESLYLTSTIPNQRTGLRDAFFNRNNSRVIITDGAGIVKIWETETGRLLSTIQGFPIQSAFFSNNDSYITSFTKNE
ncbi:MAG TPA: vWA domain-containing protein, partial [Bacteroidales bacterium]